MPKSSKWNRCSEYQPIRLTEESTACPFFFSLTLVLNISPYMLCKARHIHANLSQQLEFTARFRSPWWLPRRFLAPGDSPRPVLPPRHGLTSPWWSWPRRPMLLPLDPHAASVRRLTRVQKGVHRVLLDIFYAVHYPNNRRPPQHRHPEPPPTWKRFRRLFRWAAAIFVP
jgi:hypothetical protein